MFDYWRVNLEIPKPHQLLSLGIISAVGIYWNKTSLAAYYSVQACEFASSRQCLEIYAGLYAEGLGKHLICGLEVKSVPICYLYAVLFFFFHSLPSFLCILGHSGGKP